MITIIAYIINLLAPIVNTLGLIGLCGCVVYNDYHILTIAGVMASIGLIFGILAYKLDIPPRWFWSKSKNQIFSFTISAVLGYAVSFAMWPGFIYLIMTVANNIE